MRTYRILALSMLLLMAMPFAASAQCKGFVEKTCLPKVKPYTHNGQLNNVVLAAGESAELQMSFYSGQEYRIVVCAQEVLGEVSFKVLDNAKNVIYDSSDSDDMTKWDFKVTATQQLTVQIVVPPLDSPNALVPSGCVSVLVGFKK